ncbi:lysosomal alpha-mannosidase-like [Scaptodrosophila lebanonensis]|uniref:Alpha-mannosidase n=1 Tax=Drosophila lebanonensis TaxID=7225 RepID=A0A6J2UIS5_DROLE|nr:lysosomal alpha-mannosidase-like [Scaptodrosophila lebanonensis]
MADHVNLRCGLFSLLIFSLSYVSGYARSTIKSDGTARCGYESCHPLKPNMLNVHIVPHSHDDVGWVQTVDQYYYGTVKYIIHSVVKSLLEDPKKRFIYVESAFFFKWWAEQNFELREKVRMLVNEGRLEFISGAWSMNDEATTHYQSVIDQFAWGLRRLNDTFGECGRPRVGWQIDPFGHSREMASMLAHMGFDGMFFGRLDFQDKENRLKTKTAEMIWHGSANQGESSHLFTGALFNMYQEPRGYCFDVICGQAKINDDKKSPFYNVNYKVTGFLKYAENQSLSYRTNNVIITMGGDFTYRDAAVYYKSIDKIIRYGNERQANGSKINLFYSTPSCYLKSLHDAGITWPTKSDDFFPYASDPHAYWTGYYTSRPTLKRYERDGNHFLQVCKQLSALAPIKKDAFDSQLTDLREAMGIMQHHDAVTGTEKQFVANDYAKRISSAFSNCGLNIQVAMNQLLTHMIDTRPPHPVETNSCLLLNISICAQSESNHPFTVTLYNPLARSTNEYVRVPVLGNSYDVIDHKGRILENQIVPIPEGVLKIKYRKSAAKYELVFLASDIPPVGYKVFYIQRNSIGAQTTATKQKSTSINIGNNDLRLEFNANGLLERISSNGIQHTISQNFFYYVGVAGNNIRHVDRSSGAYAFHPQVNKLNAVAHKVKVETFKGELVEEVHQKFNDWISQVVRVYRDKPYAEFEWLVGPIPIGDRKGKEIVTRFKSDIQSNGVFYTDSNGREMMKRKRNHRDTWKLKVHEEIAGNYYPVTTKIALEDDTARMAILTDRAQGGGSLEDGALELMVHRRLLRDDNFGVEEPLNEIAYGEGLIARGKHRLIFGQHNQGPSTLRSIERQLQLQFLLPPWRFFSSASSYTHEEWRSTFRNIHTGIARALPEQVHLLTLEPWRENELLVRFEHILEKDEDPVLSKPVRFNIENMFNNLAAVGIRETTLDGNAWLSEIRRMKFVPDPNSARAEDAGTNPFPQSGDSKFVIDLIPMQIRTFVLYLAKST